VPRAETEARRVRDLVGADQVPVPVEEIARQLGATVVYEPMDRGVSGMLIRDGSSVVIGVNAGHSPARQRFSIAHEIGHLVLHRGRPMVLDHVRLNLRDEKSSTATDTEEIQANAFAAELIMPADVVLETMRGLGRERAGSEATIVSDLAHHLDVSDQAMEYRLVNLGVRRQL
jgi:Zn-dependent peptidase ImmA (M78 family)